jgi:hypothetical protein
MEVYASVERNVRDSREISPPLRPAVGAGSLVFFVATVDGAEVIAVESENLCVRAESDQPRLFTSLYKSSTRGLTPLSESGALQILSISAPAVTRT